MYTFICINHIICLHLYMWNLNWYIKKCFFSLWLELYPFKIHTFKSLPTHPTGQEAIMFLLFWFSNMLGFYKIHVLLPGFYVGTGDPNSGLHGDKASTFLSEPSLPQRFGFTKQHLTQQPRLALNSLCDPKRPLIHVSSSSSASLGFCGTGIRAPLRT